MRNLFNKIVLLGALSAFFAGLTGCNPEEEMKQFSVSFKEAGPGYVTMMATVPHAMTVSYILSETPRTGLPMAGLNLTETTLNLTGTKATFYTDGEQQLLDYDVKENTKYYLYLVAQLPDNKLSKMYTFEFETGAFVFDQLATVVGVGPDGYKMQIKVPESVKKSKHGEPGSRAIRYTQGDLMIYNFYKNSNDDYFNLLYNAGRYVTEDKLIEYSDALNYGEAGMDVNEDGVVDENDLAMQWNPIAPGEPVVFVAGEFEWMSEPDRYKNGGTHEDSTYSRKGFAFPGGWEDGYYLPCVDSAKYWSHYRPVEEKAMTKGAGIIKDITLESPVDYAWTGAFQRKIFRTRVPAKLDAGFDVQVEDLKSVNATIRITPDEEIYRYLFTVLDNGAYEQMLELLNGKEEYLQWAVTSYFAMYNFGQIQVVAETGQTSAPVIEFELTDYFFDVPADTKYHVLITGMSGDIGSPQCFERFTFSTPAKTKTRGPNIVVSVVEDKCEPYTAVFNVKCTSLEDNIADRCYYAANYKSDWIYEVNGGSSYETLGQTVQFTADELAQINSPEGYDMYIPTIDGETTRLVVVAFNDENISNGIDEYEDALAHPAVEDCVTPYAKAEDASYNKLLDTDALTGDWTISATVSGGKTLKSKVTIKREFIPGVDYPTTLPADVLATYKEVTKWTDAEIKGYFDEFKTLSNSYNTDRLRNQNKLLIEGWLDHDSQGRLKYMSPWDMFTSKDVQTVDVASMFARFGPKIHLKVNKDVNGKDSLSVTGNKMFVSPIADWNVPFYLAGRADREENNTVFQYSDANGGFVAPLEFPVTLSEDLNTITIHPFVSDKATWYPNVIGEYVNYGSLTYILENPVISEVVLTRGWTEPAPEPETPAVKSGSRNAMGVTPVGNADLVKFTPMTDFKSVRVPVRMKGEVTTLEKVQENLEKFRQTHFRNR